MTDERRLEVYEGTLKLIRSKAIHAANQGNAFALEIENVCNGVLR